MSMNEATCAFSTHGVGVTFPGPVHALEDIDLAVKPGQFVSLIGPSGCGKSTLLRLAAGLAQPTVGEVSCPARTARVDGAAGGGLAFVFQDATLLPWRSVAANVALPLELAGTPRAGRREPVERLLQLVGLSDFARRFPRELSGGMRMRVALARALVTRPRLILLDEPFAALDEITRQSLGEELRRLWARDGWTALFVTHNVAEAAFLSTRVVVMSPRPGRIVEEFDSPFGPARDASLRSTAEFASFCGRLSASLHRGAARDDSQPRSAAS